MKRNKSPHTSATLKNACRGKTSQPLDTFSRANLIVIHSHTLRQIMSFSRRARPWRGRQESINMLPVTHPTRPKKIPTINGGDIRFPGTNERGRSQTGSHRFRDSSDRSFCSFLLPGPPATPCGVPRPFLKPPASQPPRWWS